MKSSILNFVVIVSAVQAFSPSSTITSRHSSRTSLNAFDVASTFNIADALNTFYETQPYTAAFVTCSVKASAADIVVQNNEGNQAEEQVAALAPVETEKPDLDLQRTLGLCLYGGLYQGMAQEFLYNNVFPSLFGEDDSLRTVLSQVALDMSVITPFVCLPVAYMAKASVAEGEDLMDGLRKYVNHVQNEGILFKYWAFWAPFQFMTFGVVPHHLRIPFIAFFSFFWLMILSNVSARQESPVSE